MKRGSNGTPANDTTGDCKDHINETVTEPSLMVGDVNCSEIEDTQTYWDACGEETWWDPYWYHCDHKWWIGKFENDEYESDICGTVDGKRDVYDNA